MPCLFTSTIVSKIRSHEDRRKAHRRLVEHQERRARHQRAADRAHLLLAAGHRPRLLRLCRSASRGKSSNTRSMSSLIAALVAALERAHLEVLGHRHAREELAPLRRLRDARACTMSCGASFVMSWPLNSIVPVPRMVEPVDRPQRRRLAGAVRADQRDDLALAHLDRDRPSAPGSSRSTSRRPSSSEQRPSAPRSRGSPRPRRDTPRSRARSSGSPAACPRRSSRRSRAPSRGRRRP